MTVTLSPFSPAGTVPAPPSKSMAHRLLLCARGGGTAVRNVALSEDVSATLDGLAALGSPWTFTPDAPGADRRPATGTVTFSPAPPPAAGAALDCRESGSTLRFLLPLCLYGPPVTLRGSSRLLDRPLGVYEALCRDRGLGFERVPGGIRVRGRLTPGDFTVPGDVSSQFVSGLLFALPHLDGDSRVTLTGTVESRPYVDMTLDALAAFGVAARWTDPRTLYVPGGQPLHGPPAVTVEGDWSNGAVFLALGLDVTGLRPDSFQGDRVCVEYLKALDAGPAELDLTNCPDLAPVLMACAAARSGGSFTGTRRLRWKESDRGAAMAAELAKFGVPVTLGENAITVGAGLRPPAEDLDGHSDHRIVMALALLCARTGGTIRGAEAVNKSFPDFFERLRDCGAEVRQ